MRFYPADLRLLLGLALLLAGGFGGMSVHGYLQTRDGIAQALEQTEMPMAGELIVARMRAALATSAADNVPTPAWVALEPTDGAGNYRRNFLTDATGVQHGNGEAIRDTAGLHEIADRILNRDPRPTRLRYQRGDNTMLISSRYLPELDWYLILERDLTQESAAARQLMQQHLALAGGIILLALGLVMWGAQRFQKQTVRLAGKDPLTGLPDQRAFDILLQQSVRDMQRTGAPLSLLQFNILGIDAINSADGHLSGEHVLYSVAQLSNQRIRSNDILARWTGTSFIVMLRDCPVAVAQSTANSLQRTIRQHQFGVSQPVALVSGIAACGPTETVESLLERVDLAMRAAEAFGLPSFIAPP